jgi:hypothetical protein
MPEEKRKINAWIPVSLYEKLETAGYDIYPSPDKSY